MELIHFFKIRTRSKPTTYVGSLAKFRKRHTFSIEPFSSKSCLKKRAISMFTWSTRIPVQKTVTISYTCKGWGYCYKHNKRLASTSRGNMKGSGSISIPPDAALLLQMIIRITERGAFVFTRKWCSSQQWLIFFTCDIMNHVSSTLLQSDDVCFASTRPLSLTGH